jgi:Tol biopolymer transport system component
LKRRNGWIFLFGFLWVFVLNSICLAIDMTGTGFFYPTGKANFKKMSWFGRLDTEGYRPLGTWHCGLDIAGKLGDPVYAIADGTVVKISRGGWSDEEKDKSEKTRDNFGYIICHTLSNGERFIAVYGHLRRPWALREGSKVSAGQEIGRLGHWSYGIHLHFGIYQDRKNSRSCNFPSSGYGLQPNPRPKEKFIAGVKVYGNWFDPMAFIEKRNPYKGVLERESNRILFCMEDKNGQSALWTINPDGSELKKWRDWDKNWGMPAFSSDGRKILFSGDVIDDKGKWLTQSIYSMDLETGQMQRIFPQNEDYTKRGGDLDISPQDSQVVFMCSRRGEIPEIWIMDLDGRKARLLDKKLDWLDVPRWSPDGTQIVFSHLTDIVIYDLRTRIPQGLSHKTGHDGPNHICPRWSPTGEWIAFLSSDVAEQNPNYKPLTGNFWHDLYIVRPDGKERKMLVGDLKYSSGLDWSRDGKEIVLLVYSVYASPHEGGKLIVVDVENPSQRRIVFSIKTSKIRWVMWNSFRTNF